MLDLCIGIACESLYIQWEIFAYTQQRLVKRPLCNIILAGSWGCSLHADFWGEVSYLVTLVGRGIGALNFFYLWSKGRMEGEKEERAGMWGACVKHIDGSQQKDRVSAGE